MSVMNREPSSDGAGSGQCPKGPQQISRGPSDGHTPCVLISLSKHPSKVLSSQRPLAGQHLFPLLYLNNQFSELGRALLPRKEHSPHGTYRAEDDTEALWPVLGSSPASAQRVGPRVAKKPSKPTVCAVGRGPEGPAQVVFRVQAVHNAFQHQKGGRGPQGKPEIREITPVSQPQPQASVWATP